MTGYIFEDVVARDRRVWFTVEGYAYLNQAPRKELAPVNVHPDDEEDYITVDTMLQALAQAEDFPESGYLLWDDKDPDLVTVDVVRVCAHEEYRTKTGGMFYQRIMLQTWERTPPR